MAEMNFGGVMETVVTSHEFSLEKAREVLKNETIAVIGYGIQGPGQACNLRDNGFNVIVGQRQGKTYEKCLKDGWVPGKTLFSIEEAAEKGTIICMLLSDAGQIACWPKLSHTSQQVRLCIIHMVSLSTGAIAQALFHLRILMLLWLHLRVLVLLSALCSARVVV